MSTPRLALPNPPGEADDAGQGDDYLRALSARLEVIVPKILRGTLAARPAAGDGRVLYHAVDTGAVYLDVVTGWRQLGPPPRVAALPSSPANGEEVEFLADPGDGIVWHLRYLQDLPGASKWTMAGGPALYEAATPDVPIPGAAGVWQNIADGSLTVPVAGLYDVSFRAGFAIDSTNSFEFVAARIVKSGGGDLGAEISAHALPAGNVGQQDAVPNVRVTLAANTTLSWQAFRTVAAASVVRGRYLTVTPVRVG